MSRLYTQGTARGQRGSLRARRLQAWRRAVLAMAAMGAAGAAQAYSCTVSGATATIGYFDFTASAAATYTGSLTLNCSLTGNDTAGTRNFSVGASDGGNASGTQNRARLGTTGSNYLNYGLWRDSAYSLDWGNTRGSGTATNRLATSANITSAGTQWTVPFYLTVPAPQTLAAGSYSDTVTLNVYEGNNASSATTSSTSIGTGSFAVSVTVPEKCIWSQSPGTISLSYRSFQTTAATANTSFAVRCTTGTTYSLALDATSGTVLGLAYSLGLSASSGTGTGLAQSLNINASIAADQSGTCASGSCAGSQARQLTITY